MASTNIYTSGVYLMLSMKFKMLNPIALHPRSKNITVETSFVALHCSRSCCIV